jgi:ribosomal protein L35
MNKPHKGLLKRIRITKSGKVKIRHTSGRHLRSGKKSSLLQKYRRPRYASPTEARVIGRILSRRITPARPAADAAHEPHAPAAAATRTPRAPRKPAPAPSRPEPAAAARETPAPRRTGKPAPGPGAPGAFGPSGAPVAPSTDQPSSRRKPAAKPQE